MKKVQIRFPNESYYMEIEIDWHLFRIETEFENEYFGWYDGMYIAIKKS